MNILLDPRIFNFAIMSLYTLAVCRWLFAGNLWAAGYWSCALGLTIIIMAALSIGVLLQGTPT